MPRQLTEAEDKLCLHIVTSFGESDDAVTMETLLTMLRAMGANPLTREVKEVLQQQGKEDHATMSYKEAQQFIEHYLPDGHATSSDLAKTIAKLDITGSGTIADTGLRAVVTAIGSEPLTQAEADDLFDLLREEGILEGGKVHIKGYMERVTTTRCHKLSIPQKVYIVLNIVTYVNLLHKFVQMSRCFHNNLTPVLGSHCLVKCNEVGNNCGLR